MAGDSVVGHGAVGFRKEDTDLYEAFNAALKNFIGSEEHLALVTPFGFGEDFLPTKTTAELCAASRRGARRPAASPAGRLSSRGMSLMPLRPLVVCAIVAFTAGLVVASFAGFREFLPGLLEGALVTIEITIGGCILA